MGKQELRHVARLFGERIAAKRKEKGITQEALAEKLGISQESLCRMEKGLISPRFERLLDFSQALDCPIADLFAKPLGKNSNVFTSMSPSGTDAAHVSVSALMKKPNTLATRVRSLRPDAARVPRSAPVNKPDIVATSRSSNPEAAFLPVETIVVDSPHMHFLAKILSDLPTDKQKEIVEIVTRIISVTRD